MKNKYGKPYFIDQHNDIKINFNLSHDNQYVTLIYNDNKNVGIDIIDLKRNNNIINNLKDTLHLDELNKFNTDNFFYIWAFKEAYFKYLGSGISQDLLKSISYYSRSKNEKNKINLNDEFKIINKIDIFEFNELYFLELNFENYLITITVDSIDNNILDLRFLN